MFSKLLAEYLRFDWYPRFEMSYRTTISRSGSKTFYSNVNINIRANSATHYLTALSAVTILVDLHDNRHFRVIMVEYFW